MPTKTDPIVRNLSQHPDVQDRIEKQLEGFNAALLKKPFNPHEDYDWRLGYMAQREGRSLSERALRYLMR